MKWLKQQKLFFTVSLLVSLVLYAWRGIYNLTIVGEGFMWLREGVINNFWQGLPRSLLGYKTAALLMGKPMVSMFGLNFQHYYSVELITFASIAILIFILLFLITKNILFSFSSALLFSVNYKSTFGLVVGPYAYFQERVINMVPLLISAIMLHIYLSKRSKVVLYVSLALFVLASILAQWSLFFAGWFISYPIFWKNMINLILTSR